MIGNSPTETRPWGAFYILEEAPSFKVKRLTVSPGGRLSLQSHQHRAEQWTVVTGEATVTIGTTVQIISRGQSVHIKLGDIHRLENFGSVELNVIEVQVGDYFGEDDIVRYDDVYARN